MSTVSAGTRRVLEWHRRRRDSEAGDTLIEVLLALVVISLTAVSILGAFATSISATSEHRTLATADSVMRSFVESFTYDIRLAQPTSSIAWVGCASTTPAPPQYQNAVNQFNASSTATQNGYTIAITNIVNEGTCPATNAPPELITVTASTGATVQDTFQFVVSAPDAAQSAISTTQYTISPSSAPFAGGGTITVTAGSGKPFTGGGTVNFGSTKQPIISTIGGGSAVTAAIPQETSGQFQVFISVTTSAGTTAAAPVDLFTYGPTVTNVSPSAGTPAGGLTVTITGTGFTANSTVQFGSTSAACPPPTCYRGPATMVVTTPAESAGTVDVSVTNPALPASDQTSPTGSAADQYTFGLSVTSINPTSGTSLGGTPVSITGYGFTGATNITFGGVPALSFSATTDTSATATSPPGAGVADVQVVTPSGTTQKGPGDQFTYTGAGSVMVGLGVQLAGGSPTPTLNCNYKANGNNSCTISGVGCGGSATFYVESVDGTGNPVAVTTAGGLGVLQSGGSASEALNIPQGSWSTYAESPPGSVAAMVTCAKHSSSGSVTVTLSASIGGNNVSTTVKVSS